jgi:hypothetical protein
MIPRLARRRSQRQSLPLYDELETNFLEDDKITDLQEPSSSSSSPSSMDIMQSNNAFATTATTAAITDPPHSPVQPHRPRSLYPHKRPALSDRNPNAPGSPPAHTHTHTPAHTHDPLFHESCMKSPIASIHDRSFDDNNNASNNNTNDTSTNSDNTNSWSVTPPVMGARPLVVSAKRLGDTIRRKNSKRRRKRRGVTTTTGGVRLLSTNNEFSMWKDEDGAADDASSNSSSNSNPNHLESDSSDDEETNANDYNRSLPFLHTSTSQQDKERMLLSPQEQTRQYYWEWCYGSTQTTTTLATNPQSWSANRNPPTKGWYVYVGCPFLCRIPMSHVLLLRALSNHCTFILPFCIVYPSHDRLVLPRPRHTQDTRHLQTHANKKWKMTTTQANKQQLQGSMQECNSALAKQPSTKLTGRRLET